MPTPANSQSAPGSGSSYRRYFRYGNAAEVRASDAERTEVAERLSKHYSDGRLDQAEFNERLDRAMNAKTRADFNGLFYDLPDLPDESAKPTKNGPQRSNPVKTQQRQGCRMRQGSTISYLAFLAMIAIGVIVAAHVVLHSWFLWLLMAVVAFFWLRNEQGRRR